MRESTIVYDAQVISIHVQLPQGRKGDENFPLQLRNLVLSKCDHFQVRKEGDGKPLEVDNVVPRQCKILKEREVSEGVWFHCFDVGVDDFHCLEVRELTQGFSRNIAQGAHDSNVEGELGQMLLRLKRRPNL